MLQLATVSFWEYNFASDIADESNPLESGILIMVSSETEETPAAPVPVKNCYAYDSLFSFTLLGVAYMLYFLRTGHV